MIYKGYRGQEQAAVRITQGIFATEGVGVYIAMDPGMAQQFAGPGRYLQELEFVLNKPMTVSTEPLYMLHEAPEVEEPVASGDSDWLKANKLAYQESMEDGGDWEQAQEVIGHFLTSNLKKMGYDGVIVDQGEDNRWAVVFDPGKVKVLKVEKHAHLSRDTRLAQRLVLEGM
jgi:hypothetical protein